MSRPEYRVHVLLCGPRFAAEVATACGVPPGRLAVWRVLSWLRRVTR